MIKENICLSTITWARDTEEEELLRNSLFQLAALQVPVFITDGGSVGSFVDFLRSIPHFTLLPAQVKGVWAQAKNSLEAAHQAGFNYIFYTEPDKLQFFRQHLPAMLADVTVSEKTGVILASRSETGFATFPAFQQMTETTINQCCAEIIGKPFEFTYGPFLMNKDLIPYLSLVQQDIGWGFRPYIFAMAHRLGYIIESYTADFLCPIAQRQDNSVERMYRMRQLTQNIQGLLVGNTVALNGQ